MAVSNFYLFILLANKRATLSDLTKQMTGCVVKSSPIHISLI